MSDRVNIKGIRILSERWGTLREYIFEYLRSDGTTQVLAREVYDRGNSAAALIVCRSRHTVIMTRQLRMPMVVAGNDEGLIIEVPAGLLDGRQPEEAIRCEVKEEIGLEITAMNKVLEVFANPSVTTESVHLFVAQCDPPAERFQGGGLACEGEDIEIMEIPANQVMEMIRSGLIKDSKTIVLFLFATVHRLI
jgi:GDP-mannose pyrophosphatase NudK